MKKQEKLEIKKYFLEVETNERYEPYFCSVEDAITIVIVGTFCGFRNLKQIHQWASHEKIAGMLAEYFGVEHVLCYYWLTWLLKILNPQSVSECFTRWVESLLPENMDGYTISFDGKTICSTCNMDCYETLIHIVSAQIAELGLTFGQEAVEGKSNEIPATQRLIKMLKLKGCVVVADALNCQKDTATAIIAQGAEYLLSVKDNQPNLKTDIAEYVQDGQLQKGMETATTNEKNRGRIEKRTAFVCRDIEWHYYVSSKPLTAQELLKHARAEWSVESMHWLLDVHFGEDHCRVQDEDVQKTLNVIRKIVLNFLRVYRDKTNSKRPFSNLMLDCLINPLFILDICISQN